MYRAYTFYALKAPLTRPLYTALQMYCIVNNIRYYCTSCSLLAPFIIYIMPQYLYAYPFCYLTSKYLSIIKECGIVKDLLLTYSGFTLALRLYYYILLEELALCLTNIR